MSALFYVLAIFFQPSYPNLYAYLLIDFGLPLVAYILLLEKGLEASTASGLVIQVTGQKIIVSAFIVSLLLNRLSFLSPSPRLQSGW